MSLELELPRERDQRQPNYDITPIKPHCSDIHKTLCKLLFVTFNLLRASELCFHSVTRFHLPLISFINLFPVWEIIPHFWQFETAEKIYHTLHEVACQRIRSVWYFKLLGWITVNYLTIWFAYYQGWVMSAVCHAAVCSSLHIFKTSSAAETWGLGDFRDSEFMFWRVVHGLFAGCLAVLNKRDQTVFSSISGNGGDVLQANIIVLLPSQSLCFFAISL